MNEMNIDDITIGQVKEIAAELRRQLGVAPLSPHIGAFCIIRTYSNVYCGTLVTQYGREVELGNARRLLKWRSVFGKSLSDVAIVGIEHEESSVCSVIERMSILDALEIIPMTPLASESIMSAPVHHS